MTDQTTTIAQYSATDAVLADLRERYEADTWVVDTPELLAAAKKARAEIRRWRIDVEEERKSKKRQLLDDGKLIDDEAKRITAVLVGLETPVAEAVDAIAKAKKAEKERKEREEEERLTKCRTEIDRIRAIPVGLVGADAAGLEKAIGELEPYDGAGMDEFAGVAISAKAETMTKLRDMLAAATAQEEEAARVAAERAELDRLRAEQAERDRIAKEKQDAADLERREKLEAEEKEARERRAAEDALAREAREKADAEARELRAKQEAEAREKREAEEARLREQREKLEAEQREAAERDRKEREAREAVEREQARREALSLDGNAMLRTFVERFGDLEEFAMVVECIRRHLGELE
jgi:hypothetical protein